KRAGHSVTILEARKSPGGRVRTLRSFSDGLYAEAGALGFAAEHRFTWDYVGDFGLPVRFNFRFGLDQIAYMHGSRFRISPATGGGQIPFPVTPRERDAGVYGLTSLYMGEFMREIGNPLRPGWPPESLRGLDAITCLQMLRDAGASNGAIDIIEALHLGLLGYGLDSISALSAVLSEALATGTPSYEIDGGNDKLPGKFKKKLKKQLKKLAVVQRIEQNDTSVTVYYSTGGELQTITADRAVCALPFSVLKDIEVSPAFPEDKQRAIREIKLTPITRTFLQFRSRVWEQNGLDGGGISDLDIQNTHSPTLTQSGRRGILASYTGGQRALDLAAMTEEDRQDHVLRKMGNLFNGLNAQYEDGTSYIWQDDEFIRGGFTYFEPDQLTTLLPVAQRAEGRIHFAGEHTSVWHGWMNGALESGNRAADEVNSAAV
ncbi:MAG TPA: FAD-dependent oxidoreductase, partial [Blastocatellia bacterium]|nr:FAD-dependent oxidoreductase [Blastocatellia bacterium]